MLYLLCEVEVKTETIKARTGGGRATYTNVDIKKSILTVFCDCQFLLTTV